MSIGRRKVQLEDEASWVFNRMAEAYRARPAYPDALLDAIAALVGSRDSAVLDVGAGIGHVALPLAARGYTVSAVEPAREMLAVLEAEARARALPVRALHGAAEALPVHTEGADAVIVADALHFLDVELTAAEIERVLVPGGRLAVVTSDFAETPFMQRVAAVMEDAAPRRARSALPSIAQVFEVVGVSGPDTTTFIDETPLDAATLERVLASISFIGPAMNADRTTAFHRRIHEIAEPRVWSRRFRLFAGTRRRLRGPRGGER